MKNRVQMVSGNYVPQKCGLSHYVQHLIGQLGDDYDITLLLRSSTSAGWDIGTVFNLAVYLRREMGTMDILHIHHSAASYDFNRSIFLLPLLARMMGFDNPIVTTVHEYGNWEIDRSIIPPALLEWIKQFGQERGLWDREDGFLLTLSDAVVCTNGETEILLKNRFRSQAAKIRNIPISSSIDVIKATRADARRKLGEQYAIPADATVYVHFGLLHPLKGLESLIIAFREVVKRQPNAVLLLLGNDESVAFSGKKARNYRQKLLTFISALRLDGKVFITGYLPDRTVSEYLQAADIGVLAGKNGASLKSSSLLTMLFHRLPVVATYTTAAQRVLENDGLLSMVPADRADLLADEMLSLTENTKRQNLLRRNAGLLQGQYGWETISGRYSQLYRKLIRQHYEKSHRANEISELQAPLPQKG